MKLPADPTHAGHFVKVRIAAHHIEVVLQGERANPEVVVRHLDRLGINGLAPASFTRMTR